MKEKNAWRRSALIATFAILLVCLCATMIFARRTDAQSELQDEYRINTVLSVPDMQVTVDGKKYDADTTIRFPSGAAYASEEITLSEMGRYTVENRATVGGRLYREYLYFTVYKDLYETTGGMNATAVYQPSPLVPDVDGIYLRLDSGSVFRYNRVIDLEELGRDTPIITTFYSPEKVGEMDGLTLWFTLTDVYDENNYVTVRCNATRDGIGHGVTYLQAGAAGQPTTGVEWNLGKVHRNNIYGFAISASFYGVPKSGEMENNGVDLYFDTETNQVLSKMGGGNSNLVVDLDDPAYFTDLFGGFTTGEVFLSIYATDLQKSTFGLEIKSIAGHDLSQNKLVDDLGPEIAVDFGGFAEDALPQGLTGHPYPLFTAVAIDQYNGEVEVSANVYENYYSSNKIDAYVENGVFLPDHAGKYTIEYSAADWTGNVSRYPVDIVVSDSAPALVLDVDEAERVTSGYVGTKIPVSEALVSGGAGGGRVVKTVLGPDGEEIAAEEYFVPRTAGEYTVKYTAQDYVSQQKTYEYKVNVTLGSDPVFETEAELPRYFITGSTYALPKLSALNYTENGCTEITTGIKVKDGSGERTLGTDGRAEFTGSGEVVITYVAKSATGSAEKSYTVPLLDVWNEEGTLDMENYFALDGFTTRGAAEDYVWFGTSGAKDTAKLTFANPLLTSELALNFRVNTEKNAYDAVNVYLEDAKSGETLKFTYRRNGDASSFRINDGATIYNLSSSFSNAQVNEFRFRYDNADPRVSYAGDGEYVKVPTAADGTAFDGFESGLVYLTLEITGVKGDSEIFVRELNKQIFNEAPLDRVEPSVQILGSYGGTMEYGSEISVNEIVCADVLDPNPQALLTVSAPDGNPVVSVDGVTLENVAPAAYKFKLDAFGTYKISFKLNDWRNSGSKSYSVFVVDDVAPVISPEGKMISEGKLSATVVVPSVTVSDNVSSAEKITVETYVLLPTGRMIKLPGNSFIASVAGEYAVVIAARDEAGNIGTYRYNLTIKEGR